VELEIFCSIQNDFYKLRTITLIYLKQDNSGIGHCFSTKGNRGQGSVSGRGAANWGGLAFDIGFGRIIPPLDFNGGMTRGSGR